VVLSDAPAVPTRAVRRDLLTVLRRPQTIRARCAAITQAVTDERSGWFRIDRTQLDATAARVVAVMRRRFPTLDIPFHSRWRHFEAGGVDRKAELDAAIGHLSPADRARAHFDLTVVSVLLDAGAGAAWSYTERSGPLPPAALPADRVSRDDLLSMLDQAAVKSTAASTAETTAEAPAEPSAATPAETAAEPTTEPPAESSAGARPAVAVAPLPTPASAPAPTAAAAADLSRYTRSEGLGVATFRAFMAGAFSSDKAQPCRVDAAALRQLDVAALRAIFQASASNPLVGLEGRVGLLQRLGDALVFEAARDGLQARPALLFDRITDGGTATSVTAGDVLLHVLQAMGPIWTSGSMVMGVRAGDVWEHRWAGTSTGRGEDTVTRGWVPFHKLSQWLSYSLLEPLQWSGAAVTGLDDLTGLPEYRNGGLLIDTGVIVPRQARLLERRWKPADEFTVEWRAMTVTLLDELAERVRLQLGVTAEQMPLACILEGGTWAAGREIAAERRGGSPPVQIDSDGTLF
jgi:hypothetical protein